MLAVELAAALGEHDGPQIVCAQAGEVNSGAFDPLAEIIDAVPRARRVVPRRRRLRAVGRGQPDAPAHLLDGFERADSWATDGHKWLNVPYDCGIAIVADARAAARRDGVDRRLHPGQRDRRPVGRRVDRRSSRAARAAVPLYAALRSLGRDGVARPRRRAAARTRSGSPPASARDDDVEILNDVVLNQVLVRFAGSDEVTDARDRRACSATARAGPAAAAGTAATVMRISVSGWQTTAADADRSADAILAALRATTAC